MALLFGEGFEDLAQDERWSAVVGAPTVSATYGRNGDGIRLGDNHNASISKSLSISGDTYIVGFGVQMKTFGGSGDWFFQEEHNTNGTMFVGRLPGDQSALYIQDGDADNNDYNTATGVISSDVYHYIEIKKKYHATLGTLEVRVDGAIVINETNLTTGAVEAGLPFHWGNTGNTGMDEVWVDDVVIMDGSGSDNNDFKGPCVVETLLPDGNGNSSDMVGSDADSTDNYLLVNESNPNSSNYVGSDTEGEKDTYTMDNVSDSGLVVVGVIAEVISSKTDGGTKYMRPVIRVNSVDYPGDSKPLAEGYVMQSHVWDLNPNTAAAWTGTILNGTEVGQEARDS